MNLCNFTAFFSRLELQLVEYGEIGWDRASQAHQKQKNI